MTLTNNTRIQFDLRLIQTLGDALLSARVNPVELIALSAAATDLFVADGVAPASPFATVYDLADASLLDPLGRAVAFEQLELIWLKNNSTHALTLGGGADDIAQLAAGLPVPSGGRVLLCGVFAVGVGADQITVTCGAAADAYDLILVGGDVPTP